MKIDNPFRHSLDDLPKSSKPPKSNGHGTIQPEPCTRLASPKLEKRLRTVIKKEQIVDGKYKGKKCNLSARDQGVLKSLLEEGFSPGEAYTKLAESPRGKYAAERHPSFDSWMQTSLSNAMSDLAKKSIDDSIQETADGRWNILSGKDVLAGNDEEIVWAIREILETKTGLLQSGKPHGTKSLLWLCAALECVTTKTVWGKFKVPDAVRNVLFIETEDSIRLVRRRIRGFCKGLGVSYPPPGFHLICPGPFDFVEEGEQKIRDAIEETHADITVISTLQGLLAGRSYKEQDAMDPVNAASVRLQRICAIVMLTHSPQDEGKKRAVGTVTQEANYQSHMHFAKNIVGDSVITSVIFDSKDTSADSQFKLKLITEPVKHADGEIRTQVRSVEYMGRAEGGRPGAPPDKKEQAKTMQVGGMSLREIAKQLGVTKSTIERWLE